MASLGAWGAMGLGATSGLVSSEEKAREQQNEREKYSLGIYTKLVEAGWTPLDKEKGARDGKAMFFPHLGTALEPPRISKEDMFNMEAEKIRLQRDTLAQTLQLHREQQADLITKRAHEERKMTSDERHWEAIEKHDQAELKKINEQIKALALKVDKPNWHVETSKVDAWGRPVDYWLDKDRPGGYIINGEKFLGDPSQWVPKDKRKLVDPQTGQVPDAYKGVHNPTTIQRHVVRTHPQDPSKTVELNMYVGQLEEAVRGGERIVEGKLTTGGPKAKDLMAVVDKRDGLIQFDAKTSRTKYRVLPQHEVDNLRRMAEEAGGELQVIALPKTKLPGNYTTSEAVTLYIPKPKGTTVTASEIVRLLETRYGHSEEDAKKHAAVYLYGNK